VHRPRPADPVGSGLADWVETGTVGPDGSYAVEGIGSSAPPLNLHRDVIDALAALRDELVARLSAEVPGLVVNGDRAPRLPNTASLRFLGRLRRVPARRPP